jgi:hypothetical protein
VQRIILVLKRDEGEGGCTLVSLDKYNWNDQVMEDEMSKACSKNKGEW